MRLVFLSVDDEFAGSMQRYVYERHPEWVVASVISTQAIYKKTPIQAAWFVLRRSGPRYLGEMFWMKVVRKLRHQGALITPSRLANDHRVEIFATGDINSEASVRQLNAWSADLIISTNFSHYVGPRAREAARIGTWNLHKSYLPHYRGMAPSFYALLNGEERVGATLHKIAKGFDTGDIICQREVPVERGDTVYTLNQKTSEAGGRMLADYLEEVDLGGIVATPQPAGNWPTRSYPTRADIKAFRNKGLRF